MADKYSLNDPLNTWTKAIAPIERVALNIEQQEPLELFSFSHSKRIWNNFLS